MDIVDRIDQILHCNSEGGEPAEVTNWEYEDGDSDPLEAFDGEYDYIDAQLAQGPQDDYNADRYDKCWHCGDDYHGLPITEAMRHLRNYAWRHYTMPGGAAICTVDELLEHGDTSPVICHGSEFIGPQLCSMTLPEFCLPSSYPYVMPEYRTAARYIDQIQYVRIMDLDGRDATVRRCHCGRTTPRATSGPCRGAQSHYLPEVCECGRTPREHDGPCVDPALMEPWTQPALYNGPTWQELLSGPTWQELMEAQVLPLVPEDLAINVNLWFPNDEDPAQTCVAMAGDDEDVA